VAVTVGQTLKYGCFFEDAESEKQLKPDDANHAIACLVAGALVIPFRYELSGNKDVLGGVSGDLFAGVNFSLPNGFGSIVVLGYVGYLPTFNSTSSSTTGSSSGTSSSSSSTSASATNSTGGALDAGFGITLPVTFAGKASNVGIVVGTDRTGRSNNYAYNAKWYTSVLIGFNF
jgi:hypothetical protein